jgi:hypothetical protein
MSISILFTSVLTNELLEKQLSCINQPIHQIFFHSSALESDFSVIDATLQKFIKRLNIVHIAYCGSALEKRQISPSMIPSYIKPNGLTEFYTQLHSTFSLIQY